MGRPIKILRGLECYWQFAFARCHICKRLMPRLRQGTVINILMDKRTGHILREPVRVCDGCGARCERGDYDPTIGN